MGELLNEAKAATSLFCGGLVVGDHASITVFGMDQQNDLRECTRRLLRLMRENRNAAYEVLENTLLEVDRLEKKTSRWSAMFIRKSKREDGFERLCECVESATSQLEIQQAQIVKESEMLRRLDSSFRLCETELGKCIEEGRSCLSGGPSCSSGSIGAETADELDQRAWYERLSKRIDELSVSQVVAAQSRAQIAVLRKDNLATLDKISGFVFNLASICQSQLAGRAGASLCIARFKACESVLESVGECAGKGIATMD